LLGGVHFFWGPAVGALGFAILEYGTRTLHGISEIVTGAILLAVVLAAPGGILGAISRIVQRLSLRGGAR
jgi:branched-chain amino acid transport system permease protein